jgi:hypothetical protein
MRPGKSNGNLPDIAPQIIDTCFVGVEPDGTPVYASAREAGIVTLASGLLWTFDHPHETLQFLALASLAAGSLYVMCDTFAPVRVRARRRR